MKATKRPAREKYKPKEIGRNGGMAHITRARRRANGEGDRVFEKQTCDVGNTRSMAPLVLPTPKLCAAQHATAGVLGGSEQRDERHITTKAVRGATENGLRTTGDQGGPKHWAIATNDARHVAQEDIISTNTTTAEGPIRRAVTAITDWVVDELPHTSAFPGNQNSAP